jgi:hypothetical protein
MTSIISATFSEEKLAAIRALFAYNGWEFRMGSGEGTSRRNA